MAKNKLYIVIGMVVALILAFAACENQPIETTPVTDAPTEALTDTPTEEPTTEEATTEEVTTEEVTTEEVTTEEPTTEEVTTEEPTTEEPTTEEPTTEEVTTEEPTTEEVTEPQPEPETAPPSVIDAISPTHGSTVCVANSVVSQLVTDYKIGASAPLTTKGDIYAPLPLTLTWEDVGATLYRVRVATTPDFSDSQVALTSSTTTTFPNPYTGTAYYWQVEAIYKDHTDASAIFVFRTAATPRTVYIDGVSNTRDLGGYMVSPTQRVRQGLVYRSGYLQEITPDGLYQAKEELGIRCELDIRTPGEGGAGTQSSLGADMLYYNINGIHYSAIKDATHQQTLGQEIKVFADPNNYPLVFHCSLGRDRTGTLAMLILGLCGVSEQDICMDYELSLLSTTGCLDNTSITVLMNAHFLPMINYINSVGGKDTFKENVEVFLTEHCGVTAEEIASIRSILIEEVE